MRLKKSYRAIAAFALAIVLRLPVRAQTVDCIVAVVNGRPITLVDLRIAQRFGFYARPDRDGSLKTILEEFIGRRLVIVLAREQTPVDAAAIDAGLEEVSARMGPEAMAAGLKEFGMERADLRTCIEEGLLYDSIIASRFGQTSPVTLDEIEAYYRDVYAIAEKQAGREPAPMVQALGLIEALLQGRKKAEGIEAWTKNLRAQAEIRINEDCLE